MGLLELRDRAHLGKRGTNQIEALDKHQVMSRRKLKPCGVMPASDDALVNVDRYPIARGT